MMRMCGSFHQLSCLEQIPTNGIDGVLLHLHTTSDIYFLCGVRDLEDVQCALVDGIVRSTKRVLL